MSEYVSEEAVQVHIVGDSTQRSACNCGTKKRYRAEYQTVVLSSKDPVQEILPQSEGRHCAYIMPIDNDIVIGKDASMCGASSNTVTNVPSPSGTYVPAKTTGGALQWLPVYTTDKVYAGITTTGSNSRVSIVAYYEVSK